MHDAAIGSYLTGRPVIRLILSTNMTGYCVIINILAHLSHLNWDYKILHMDFWLNNYKLMLITWEIYFCKLIEFTK